MKSKHLYFTEPLFRLPWRFSAISSFEKRTIEVKGISTSYLTAAVGPPLVLLCTAWVQVQVSGPGCCLPWRVTTSYAIDRPGYNGSSEPPDYAPAFTAPFVSSFLDTVGVERAVVVGNSFGGLVALRLALSEPERVSALVLVDSAGLGRAVNPAVVILTLPGGGEMVAAWEKTPLGSAQRAFRGSVAHIRAPVADTPNLVYPMSSSLSGSYRFSANSLAIRSRRVL